LNEFIKKIGLDSFNNLLYKLSFCVIVSNLCFVVSDG